MADGLQVIAEKKAEADERVRRAELAQAEAERRAREQARAKALESTVKAVLVTRELRGNEAQALKDAEADLDWQFTDADRREIAGRVAVEWERYQQAAEAAARRERERIEAEARAKAADEEAARIEAERKAADVDYRRRINHEALADIIATAGCDEETGKLIIRAIAAGIVRHVRILY